jgi:hypothetical protein
MLRQLLMMWGPATPTRTGWWLLLSGGCCCISWGISLLCCDVLPGFTSGSSPQHPDRHHVPPEDGLAVVLARHQALILHRQADSHRKAQQWQQQPVAAGRRS